MTSPRLPIARAAAAAMALTLVSLRAQTVQPTVPAGTDDNQTVQLTPFEVSASQDEGYAPSESLSGTKVRTELRNIPMNIQVVTSDFINDIGAFDLSEAMAYNASVVVSSNDYQATIRGFSSDWQLRNGFRYYKRTDSTKVARIETISGPAAVLYGITQPGGIINVITKQPNGTNSGWIRETYSTQDHERMEGNFNYRLSNNVSLLLVGAYDHDDSSVNYSGSYFRTLSPTLVWQINKDTKLVADFEWTNFRHHFNSGYLTYNSVPIQAPKSEGGFGIPQNWNYEGPDNHYGEVTRTGFISLEHAFSRNATIRFVFNQHEQKSSEEYMGIGTTKAPAGNAEGIPKNTPVVEGTWRYYILNNRMQSAATDALFRFDTGPVKNQILAGGQVGVDKFYSPRWYDWDTAKNTYVWRYWDLTNPNPNLSKPSDVGYIFQTKLSTSSRREENTVASAYLTHQGRMLNDHIITLAGVFYSSIDDYIRAFDGEQQRYSASKVTPQAGVVVRPINWLSLYALYATSLYPQPGGATGGFGEIFPPVKGKSFEYGAKFDNPTRTLSGTVSIYDIRQEGRVIFDPTAPNAQNPTADPNLPLGANVATGETQSKGVDLSAYYKPFEGLQFVGSYAYNDTEILHDKAPYLVGRKVTPFYRNRAALWVKYAPRQLRNWSIGVGPTWQGKAIRGYSSSSASGIPNTAKAQFNAQAVLTYGRKIAGYKTTFQINCRNVFHDETVAGGKGDLGYYFTNPREVRFSVTVAY
ncbi:MAG TPA: TonB-dependent receptor [Opitutaceae bacterium]|nr:TonB-dependent receptor [Opitutaceae bacterium]